VLPDVACKGYAATQAAEEARHGAVLLRYTHQRKLDPYPASRCFEQLLAQILSDRHWDIQALGMQIIVESLAWAAFRLAANTFEDPLIRRITELLARDEVRHISFGVLLLEGICAFERDDESIPVHDLHAGVTDAETGRPDERARAQGVRRPRAHRRARASSN
jgi:hypothetical protein